MYARTTTITAQAGRIDDGIALVNELMPSMSDIQGWMGVSLLVDRSSRRCIAATSWENESAMRASIEQVKPLRDRLVETLGGGSPEIQAWEIALLHRDHESPDGAAARVTWGRPRQGELDATVDYFKSAVLPRMETRGGFCSFSMLVNREDGMMCGTAAFESMAALEATREFVSENRAIMTEQTGIEFVDILECELAVHHLRVPELV